MTSQPKEGRGQDFCDDSTLSLVIKIMTTMVIVPIIRFSSQQSTIPITKMTYESLIGPDYVIYPQVAKVIR